MQINKYYSDNTLTVTVNSPWHQFNNQVNIADINELNTVVVADGDMNITMKKNAPIVNNIHIVDNYHNITPVNFAVNMLKNNVDHIFIGAGELSMLLKSAENVHNPLSTGAKQYARFNINGDATGANSIMRIQSADKYYIYPNDRYISIWLPLDREFSISIVQLSDAIRNHNAPRTGPEAFHWIVNVAIDAVTN